MFGREAVLESAWDALRRPAVVLLEGPAGIGKTTLLGSIVDRARAAGMRVLTCAPTEAESQLPLAALGDLLHPLRDRLDELPGPQRSAAQAALLVGDGTKAVDERALGAATRVLLESALADAPAGLVVAIDDAPWVDPPSGRALRFALRRTAGRIGVLVSSRTATSGATQLPLGLADADHDLVALDPLGTAALRRVLSDRFDVSLGRPTLARIAHESGGNPLLAIELARAVIRAPIPPHSGDDLPVVGSIQELVDATLATLPERAREAVQLASLLTSPSVEAITATGVEAAVLDALEDSGLVRVNPDGRVAFVHPTFITAVRAAIPPGLRRRLHRRLAGTASDPDERARHLARGSVAADVATADQIAAAAARARERGAPELAADLYRRAAELTPTAHVELRQRRQLACARCLFDSGDYPAARTLAASVAQGGGGDVSAEAWLLDASIAFNLDDLPAAVESGQRALAAASPDSPLAGRIHAHLSVFVDLPAAARPHAEAALRLIPRDAPKPDAVAPSSQDDRPMLASALLTLFYNEVRSGQPPRTELLDQVLAEEGDEPYWLAGTIPAIWWKYTDQHERARRRLEWMYERAVASGDEPFQHEIVIHQGEAELLAGRYDSAQHWLELALELGTQLNTGLVGETWLLGTLAARRGDLEAARATAEAGLRAADEFDDQWRRRLNLQLAGTTALTAGRAADAAAAFSALAAAVDGLGLVEPLGSRFEDDWAEALVGVGDLAGAEAVIDRLEIRHRRLPRPWTRLGLARARLLLAAARRDPVDDPLEVLIAARASVPADVLPLERARCLFVAGMTHRRARRKQAAREALATAFAEFTALGARAHATRVEAELDRIGARTSSVTELSATEQRVARLAADGKTNRVIADELFISPKTVESNLVRAYRKLGITRRAELGVALDRRDA